MRNGGIFISKLQCDLYLREKLGLRSREIKPAPDSVPNTEHPLSNFYKSQRILMNFYPSSPSIDLPPSPQLDSPTRI